MRIIGRRQRARRRTRRPGASASRASRKSMYAPRRRGGPTEDMVGNDEPEIRRTADRASAARPRLQSELGPVDLSRAARHGRPEQRDRAGDVRRAADVPEMLGT